MKYDTSRVVRFRSKYLPTRTLFRDSGSPAAVDRLNGSRASLGLSCRLYRLGGPIIPAALPIWIPNVI